MNRFSVIFLIFVCFTLFVKESHSAGEAEKIKDVDFSFEGPFGTFDRNQLQRGLQVYTEVCAGCHGMKQVAFRTLGDPGGPELEPKQVKAYAAQYEIYDAELDDFRDGKPSDKFPVSGVENAPDLSLIAKARAGFHGPYGTGINQLIKGMGGPEYIVNLLAGFTGEERNKLGLHCMKINIIQENGLVWLSLYGEMMLNI